MLLIDSHQAVLREPQAGPKVPQPDVSISCQQDVVRLDISGRYNRGPESLPEDLSTETRLV